MKIKLPSKKKTLRPIDIPLDEYTGYMDILLNHKLLIFISTVQSLIKIEAHKDFSKGTNEFASWNALMTFNFVYCTENNADELFKVMNTIAPIVLSKLHNLYCEIYAIIPDYFLEQLKYNFYRTLIVDYLVNIKTLDTIEYRFPFLFLIPIMRSAWMDGQLQLQALDTTNPS